jgi:hypothetical protein
MNDLDNNGERPSASAIEKWLGGRGRLRDAYYKAFECLKDFQDAAVDLEDPHMKEWSRKALYSLDHLHDNLENKYIWD